jgi:lipopolysaccharide transport system ATP-binding protein
MSNTVIKVENISKQYRLGTVSTGTLSHDLNRWWHTVRGKEDPYLMIGETNDRTVKGSSEYVWALRNINFDVNQGEVLGIIGRNGAGKSTLLKILSRTTSPTTGIIKIKGRVASLLEVGTGFHPELSGRDNIFLNGAILGMTKEEIKRKFDEIVDFAGVERYIDTPVKRYSSGMYVRLAFAVAAHLEPEILIVDEVLAVGDAEFQKKALGKMKDVSEKDKRTVLFVSHNMAAISQLCTSCISMNNGTILEIGAADKIVSNYLSMSGVSEPHVDLRGVTLNRVGNKKVEFVEVFLKEVSHSAVTRLFSVGDSICINFTMKLIRPNQKSIKTSIELKTSEGIKIANMIDVDSGFQVKFENEEFISYEVVLRDVRLYPDTYYLSLYAGDMSSTEAYDYIEDCISFDIIDGGELTSRTLPRAAGLLFLTPEWNNKSNK